MKKNAIILASCIIALASCYTQNKAKKQTQKVLKHFPSVIAQIARDSFPCIPRVIKRDSAEYKKFLEELEALQEKYKSKDEPEPAPADTVILQWEDSTRIHSLLLNIKYWKKQSDKKDEQIKALNAAMSNLPAIHDTIKIEDSSKIKLLISENAVANKKITSTEKKVERRNTWLWIALAVIVVLSLILLYLIKKLTSPKNVIA